MLDPSLRQAPHSQLQLAQARLRAQDVEQISNILLHIINHIPERQKHCHNRNTLQTPSYGTQLSKLN